MFKKGLKFLWLLLAVALVAGPNSKALAQKEQAGGLGEASINGFCQTSPQLAYSDMNIAVSYTTPSGPGNQTSQGSNGQGNNSGLTVEYPGDVWDINIQMDGSAGPGDAEGFVRSTVEVNGVIVFDQTDYGSPATGPASSHYDYTVPSVSTSGYAVVVTVHAEACDKITDQNWYVFVNNDPIGFSCTVTEATYSLEQGGSHVYTINSTSLGGFSSPVTFSASVIPGTGTPPQVTMSGGNPHTPSGTASAIAFAPSGTTAQTYTVTFSGSGGGKTASCNTQLIVNPQGPSFALVLTPVPYTVSPECPTSGTCTFPNGVLVQDNLAYQLFVECTGGFSGPVTSLIATVAYQGATITFNNGTTLLPSLACGATTPVTVNTSGVQSVDASTPQGVIMRNILITGQGAI